MKALFHCSQCKSDTPHNVESSKIVEHNIHTKLKCMECKNPPFTWVAEKHETKALLIFHNVNST